MRVWAVLIWCLLTLPVCAQTESETLSGTQPGQAIDTTRVDLRSFDSSTLQRLQTDKDLDYRQPPSVAESLWDRLMNWLGDIFSWLLRGAVETNWGRVFLFALGLVVLIVVVMQLLKVDALRVFYSGADQGSLSAGVLHENIHVMDFEKLIREASAKHDYRQAIRLTFLYALKLLADRQLVTWKPGKTNHDYVSELTSGKIKTGLNELSFFFEYAWYGKFPVNEVQFSRVQQIFDDWKKNIT